LAPSGTRPQIEVLVLGCWRRMSSRSHFRGKAAAQPRRRGDPLGLSDPCDGHPRLLLLI